MTAVVLLLCMEAMLADDYRIREHGSAVALHLTRTRPARCSPLVTAAVRHPSAEVRTRCARLAPRYRAHLAAVYVPSGVPCWPCLDMVPDATPDKWSFIGEWRCRACAEGVPLECTGAPYWWSYRRATELWIRTSIADGLSYADADAVLAALWSRELDYHAAGFAQWMPAVWDWQRRG